MYANIETEKQKKARELFGEFERLFQYFESYRNPWDTKAINWYKQLVGYKEELDEDDNRSNLHIPRTYQIVDTIRARIVMAFFKNYPYVEFIPQPSQLERFAMQEAEDKADIASALVNEQLKKNEIVSKFYDFTTSFLTFPKAILGVGWRYEQEYIKRKVPVPEIIQTQYGLQYTGEYVYEPRESLEATWDDNEIKNIDYFDFWADPKGSNIDDSRGVFVREFITLDDIAQMLNFLDYLDEGEIYLDDLKELEEIQGALGGLERGREQRLSAVNISDSGEDIYSNMENKDLNKNTEFEILHYWEDNRHLMMVNRQKVIYDGPSPYWRHRKKPFIAASFDKLPNEFYGMSAVQIISDLQEEENTIHNQRSDNVNFILNKMWKIRRGADIDKSQLVSRPHGYVEVDRLDDVDELSMTDVAASSFTQQNIISTIMENTLATPPVIRGAESRGDKTATETIKQSGNAGMRFDVKVKLYEIMGINRMFYLMDMNNQQFIDTQRIVKLNEDGNKWRNVNPGQLIGEYDYRPAGANIDPAANKEIRREQLTHMMQFLLQSQVPFVNYHKLFEEWLKSFDIENAEKFILPEDVWRQMQFMMQQQQAGQQQNNPTAAQQSNNAITGRARGRRPQTERNPDQRSSGVVR